MIEDPYKVLGISRNATEDEIKRAYRKKAKEYHPDLHPDDPIAAQKMNEINQAYDMLRNPEKYEARQKRETQRQQNNSGYSGYGYGQQNNSQSYGGWTSDFGGFDFSDFFGFGSMGYDTSPKPQSGDPPELVRAIDAIQRGQFAQAVDILSKMTSTYRNDRWYYVSAAAYKGNGELSRAQDMIERAIQMNTENPMYRQFRQEIFQEARSETGAYNSGVVISPLGCFFKVMLGIIILRLIMFLLSFLMYGFRF